MYLEVIERLSDAFQYIRGTVRFVMKWGVCVAKIVLLISEACLYVYNIIMHEVCNSLFCSKV